MKIGDPEDIAHEITVLSDLDAKGGKKNTNVPKIFNYGFLAL